MIITNNCSHSYNLVYIVCSSYWSSIFSLILISWKSPTFIQKWTNVSIHAYLYIYTHTLKVSSESSLALFDLLPLVPKSGPPQPFAQRLGVPEQVMGGSPKFYLGLVIDIFHLSCYMTRYMLHACTLIFRP